jgi:dTDP-glucose 4,6-dehydratase
MDTLLVTGGAGFIGGNFVRWMLSHYAVRIVNLDRLTYAGSFDALAALGESPQHKFVQGDISDRELVGKLLREYKCRAIVHFAAETHVDRSIGDPGSFVRTNVVGTFELLEAALNYWEALGDDEREQFRFLHISTDEVYGSLPAEGYFTEYSSYAPNSPYSASKAASDHFVRAYHHTYGLPVVTTNCSNNYGPYQFPEKLIPLTILNVLDGKPVNVYGNGKNVRDWLHVEDHCRALQLVLERGRLGEVYNIGGNCERTNLDVVTTICKIVDSLRPGASDKPSTSLLRFVADRPGHDFRYAIDCSKIQRQLGWKPIVSFANGIAQTIRWYQENSAYVDSIRASTYQGERLGLGRNSLSAESQPAADSPLATTPAPGN